MKAILRREFGDPDVLVIRELPPPPPCAGEVTIEVKAFGINHAEIHMRRGEWPEAAPVSGIECAGLVQAAPDGSFTPGQAVVALMGGMGRSINGSYAQYTRVPAANVVAVDSQLAWPQLAAIPESYATAWACLHGNLKLCQGQRLLIRGATSALGQAALNIARGEGAVVVATTRNPQRVEMLQGLGADAVVLEGEGAETRLREQCPQGFDAVLELIGNRNLLTSLTLVRAGGCLCLAGFVGGLAPLDGFNPLLQMPSRVHFSFFGSFVFGSPAFPLSDIPMQTIVERVERGQYQAEPRRVFAFEQIADAHRLMESNAAGGKIVVEL